MKQLERRLLKLEAPATRAAEIDREFDMFYNFVTDHELEELISIERELGGVYTLQQFEAHPLAGEIVMRSATRRQRYPFLWQIQMWWRDNIAVPRPWSAELEIEVFRSEIALNWEKRGFALGLDGLSPDELRLSEHFRPLPHLDAWITRKLPATWSCIRHFATLPRIQQAVAKIWFDSRATNLHECAQMEELRWEPVERPLTLADLKLDPATFPGRAGS